MAGNEIYGILDESKLKKASGAFPKEAEYKTPVADVTGVGARVTPKEVDAVVQVSQMLPNIFKDSFFEGQWESDAEAKIEGDLASLGFEVKQITGGVNRLRITNPATKATIDIDTNEDASGAEEQGENLRKWINSQLTDANAAAFLRVNQPSGELDG